MRHGCHIPLRGSTLPRLALGLAAALLSLLACGLPAARAATVSPALRGVQIDTFLHEDPSRALADVDAAAALGANAVRLPVSWAGLEERSKGDRAQWYLDRLDAVVARARSRGLKVLLAPVFTPCWARRGVTVATDGSCPAGAPSQATPPRDPQDFATFAAWLANRYREGLAGIEMWNEPNLDGFWATAQAASDYAALLKAAYPAVKQAAPGVTVVGGVLSGGDATFLAALYAAGIKGSYDALSVHPYNDGRAPEALIDSRWAAATFLQGLRAIAATMTAARETRPLWVTEMGWNTSTRRGELWLDGVGERDQAAYLQRALKMLTDSTTGIAIAKAVFVYRLRDTGDDAADPQQNYGLQHRDGSAKPALAAVRDSFTAMATGATPPAPAPPTGGVPKPTGSTSQPVTPAKPATPAKPTKPGTRFARGVFAFPRASRCVRRSRVTIRLRAAARDDVTSAELFVGSTRRARASAARHAPRALSARLPHGRSTVRVVATLRSGASVSASRTYRTCG